MDLGWAERTACQDQQRSRTLAPRPLHESGVAPYKGKYANIAMNGKEVYKFATRKVPTVIEEALGNAGLGVEQVDWLLLHQANIRIMDVVADRLGMPKEKVRPCGGERDETRRDETCVADRQAGRHASSANPHPYPKHTHTHHPVCTDPDEPVGVRQHQRGLHPPGTGRGRAGGQGQEGRRHRLRGLWGGAELGVGHHQVRRQVEAPPSDRSGPPVCSFVSVCVCGSDSCRAAGSGCFFCLWYVCDTWCM